MSTVIRASRLSKVYKLYWGPRSLLKEILFNVPSHHPLWALKDVDFEITEGEAFGVIGQNGAGKSTLLKILTGTAFPSSGSVEVNGTVSALLELGAGFHPEFSGRENIYFNGALMGCNREEIRASEEEIIAFSELEEFIDKPVKTYSSGMYVRLGFAIATGFAPAVLIIDEALAVGDQRFQKKCTDRILSFKKRGKTILFCSHNLYQVKTLCDRALWLHRGEPQALGRASEVVDRYTDYIRDEGEPTQLEKVGKEICWIKEVQLLDSRGQPHRDFETGETLQLRVRTQFTPEFQGTPGVGISLLRNDGVLLYTTTNTMEGIALERVNSDEYACSLVLENIPLLSGSYYFNVVTTDHENMQAYDIVEKAEPFTVRYSGKDFGLVKLSHRWR